MNEARMPDPRPGPAAVAQWGTIALVALVLSGALAGGQTALPPQPIAQVRILGNQSIATPKITALLHIRPGVPMDPSIIDQDVRALLGTNWFVDVVAEYTRPPSPVILTFRVQERPMVKGVRYVGNKKISEKELIKATGIEAGSRADGTLARQAQLAIERLYHDKGYLMARVDLVRGGSSGDRDVVFQIFEGPKIVVSSVQFVGNTIVPGARLLTQISTQPRRFWLFGGQFDQAVIEEDEAKLRKYYRDLGYFDVEVSHSRPLYDDRHEKVTVRFVIHEGQRYTIHDIRFVGNQQIPSRVLVTDLKTRRGAAYRESTVKADLQKIQDVYGSRGFIDAQIVPEPHYLSQPGVLDLVFKVSEGQSFRLGELSFTGNSHTRDRVLRREFLLAGINPGEVIDVPRLRRAMQRLGATGLFAGAGTPGAKSGLEYEFTNRRATGREFAFAWPDGRGARGLPPETAAETSPAPSSSPPAPQADRVAGAEPSLLPFEDSAAGLPVKPAAAAAPASPAAAGIPQTPVGPIDPAQPAQYEITDPTQPQASRPADPFEAALADIAVRAEEAPTGRLMFGLGVNSDAGLAGSIILDEKNFDLFRFPHSFQDVLNGDAFRGGGQEFRIEAVPGTIVNRFVISLREPALFDSPYALGVSGFAFNRLYDDWRESREGGNISLSRTITQELSASVTAEAANVGISHVRPRAPDALLDVRGNNFLATIKFALTHDTRDSPFLPSAGHFIEASYSQGLGDFTFPQALVEGRQYFLISERPDGSGKQVLSLRGTLGYSGPNTPIFERFFAGGFQTFRGFEYRGVGPYQRGVNVGGDFMALGSVEYQFPLLASDMLQGVVFSDFGMVEPSVELRDFRLSVGVGLRVVVPFLGPVPIAFDFAAPILKERGDRTQIFSFFIGFFR